MKHLLYTLLLGVFLTSCYRKIDLNEYRTTPKMVINSVVSPDTVVMASITPGPGSIQTRSLMSISLTPMWSSISTINT